MQYRMPIDPWVWQDEIRKVSGALSMSSAAGPPPLTTFQGARRRAGAGMEGQILQLQGTDSLLR